jgi:hypothetical protein
MELPSEARIVALVTRASEVWRALLHETAQPHLVLPNGASFPDVFEPSANGVQRLLRRMQTHASLLDVPIEVVLHEAEADHSQGACGSGSCAPKTAAPTQLGRLQLSGDLWRLNLARDEIGHAVGLTTLMARALGTILLDETRPEGVAAVAHPPELAELAAIQLGFGCLLLEGAHVYSKSCGGPRVAQLTALELPELAVLVALFASANQLKLKPAYAWLSATQRSSLSDAEDLLRANPSLAGWVRNGAPPGTAGLKLKPPKPRLFAWLQPKSKASDDELAEAFLDGTLLEDPRLQPSMGVRQLPAAARKAPPTDELGRLVEEALAEARS